MRTRGLLLSVALGMGFAQPSFAEQFPNCSPEQKLAVADALRGAKDMTLKAAVAVADTPIYARWFGDYSQSNAEHVRATLKRTVAAVRTGAVIAECHEARFPDCQDGRYAYVFPTEPYVMHLCPPFFGLPRLATLRPGAARSENGTQEGTIVHEISHFVTVADTEDHCYSRRDCSRMARGNADLAVDNADSYQYFTEDVIYYARQPLTGKP